MALTLNDNECAVLEQALGYYLPQLRMERIRSEARDAQHALLFLETNLEAINQRLHAAARSPETPHAHVP